MVRTLLIFLAHSILAASTVIAQSGKDFEVSRIEQDGTMEDLKVYPIKVDQVINAQHHVEEASMALFTLDSPTSLRIISHKPVKSVRIRPLSSGVSPKISGDTLWINVEKTGTLSIEINGDIYHNLHLIANHPTTAPSVKRWAKGKEQSWKTSNDGKTIVFTAGHHILPDGHLTLKSGQTVYVSEGAWVEGGLQVKDVENVHVYGPGIVRPKDRGYGIEIAHSRNILVEDITTTQVPTGGSEYVTIRNVKGFTHYGWGDGMNIFASSHVTQEGCFLRTSDDCVTVYATRMGYVGGAQDITVRDMTLWADVAHPIFIGLHGAAAYVADNKDRQLPLSDNAEEIAQRHDTIARLSFKNIDILEQNEKQVDYQGCMAIVCGDNNVVRDVTFDSIRVDSIRQGSLLTLRVFENKKYCKAPGQAIENITLRNITSAGGGELSIIEGYSAERAIRDVHFENLQVKGVLITDTMQAKPKWYKTTDMCRMLLGSFAENITFE